MHRQMTQEEYTDSMQKWVRNIKTHQTESWNGYEGQQEGFILSGAKGRPRKMCAFCWMRQLILWQKKVINALFTLVFTGKTSLQEFQVSQTSRKKVQSKEDLSSVEQDWVRDHLKKKQTYTSLWDLIGCTHKAGQPHCNPWEGEAANSLEHHFQEHGGQEAWIYMYVMLNQPDFLLWWND